MSLTRLTVLTLMLLVAALLPAAAPPTPLPIARWVEDLGSDDDATWRKAQDDLWRSGERAIPALRKAAKHTDPDVVLRARLVLSKLEWGIRPDTPAAVLAEIERYRDGDRAQKKAAVTQLLRQGRAGYVTLRFLLARETDAEVKKEISERLKELVRPAAREQIARGELEDAEKGLAAAAQVGSDESLRDLAAFWALAGKGEKLAPEMGKRHEDARQAALLYRALGDLKAAREQARRVEDKDFLGAILDEAEDFKELARLAPPHFKDPRRRASLLYRAGDRAGFESALAGLEKPEERLWVSLYNGRPREGIDALNKDAGRREIAAALLTQQGRLRETLALRGPDDPNSRQPVGLLLEQAVAASRMGDKAAARKMVEAVAAVPVGSVRTEQGLPNPEFTLGLLLRAGRRGGWLDDAVADVGKLLDGNKTLVPGPYTRAQFAPGEEATIATWWAFLRKTRSDDAPSASLRLLADWFIKGKADKDFEATVAAARKYDGFAGPQKERWAGDIARACVKAGKPKLAEEVLKEEAAAATTPAPHLRYADLLFDQKRWEEAGAAYEKAVKIDPTAAAPLYLRGLALIRAGKEKEGKPLVERARLLPLAEEDARFALAEELTRRGLADEADAERLVLTRTAAFRSVYASNASSILGNRAAQEGRHFEAARHYRRLMTNGAFSGASFTDPRAFLLVPGWAQLYEARGLIGAGKLDAALDEARLQWVHLPEDVTLVPELVRALEKAERKPDADRLFAERFALAQRGCVEAPRSTERHNRLAWLAARCGRRLDTALQHARRATELSPKSAGAFDTLAEVHFQRGDKDEALAAIKEAVKLAPKQPYYAAQLKRIEAGDPKAEVPKR